MIEHFTPQHLRYLGSTNLQVSPIGLGTVKFGRNTDVKYPQSFSLPTKKQLRILLDYAYAGGINMLDTAPAYGDSESILGELLIHQRNRWVIVSKTGETYINQRSIFDFRPQAIQHSIEQSLKRLKTDFLDIALIHSDGNDLDLINQFAVFDTLTTLKTQGLIRYYGMSCKTIAGGLATLQHADIAMITYNLADTSQYPVLKQANQLHKGILIKKALGSGHLLTSNADKPLEQTYQQLLNLSNNHAIIIGTINPDHLQQHIQSALTILNKTS